VKLYYCDHHSFPLPAGHKFPAPKYRLLREALARNGGFEFDPAPMADPAVIGRAHDPDYVRRFPDGSVEAAIMRRIGFPWSPELVRRTLAPVGGTLSAAGDALNCGVGGNLAGGTHHAFYDAGAGFCVFNDLAVAIRDLRARGAVRRAAVVDLDVHQGDGTARLFEDSPEVLTLSIHGGANFPFLRQHSCVDVELADRTGDDDYLAALEHALPQVFDFSPDIVFYQAGVDTLATDRLGRLALTHSGLERRDQMVLDGCRSRGTPVVITLGGGYSDPIALTVAAHAYTFRLAARLWM